MARSVSTSTKWCALCGLPIPDEVVSREHPLYGTVDHLIPKGKGGSNALTNRVAAHRHCNLQKDDRLGIDPEEIEQWRKHVKLHLEKLGRKVTKAHMSAARRRAYKIPEYYRKERRKLPHIMRWEDDGGAIDDRRYR